MRNRTIRSNPHNNVQSEKIRKIPHNTDPKRLLEISIKTGISNEYQDFSNIFRLFSDYLPSGQYKMQTECKMQTDKKNCFFASETT